MNPKTKIAMLPVLMLIAAGVFYYDSKGPSFSRRASSFSTSPYLPLSGATTLEAGRQPPHRIQEQRAGFVQ